MNRLIVLLMTCLVTAAVFAGCHEPTPTDGPGDDGTDGTDGTDGGDGGDGRTVTLTVEDAPDIITANSTFNVTVGVESDGTVPTSHYGAHWSYNSTADADAATLTPQDFDGGSPHVLTQTDLGDTYTIENWTFGEEFAGQTIYFRAHVLSEGVHYWSDEEMIVVGPSS